MFVVFYWDAYGVPHCTQRMDRATAEAFAESMHPTQEARLVYVTR
jgi:hypothetical protein